MGILERAFLVMGMGWLCWGVAGCASKQHPLVSENPELAEKVPYLKDATVERMLVPGKIEGNRYIWGHWVDIIERPASWGTSHDEH